MKLTKELLIRAGACEDGIEFCEKFKLFGFPLDRIDEIKGDYSEFVFWLKCRTFYDNSIEEELGDGSCETYHYDDNNNVIKVDYSNGSYATREYDDNNNLIKVEYSNGSWASKEYDDNNTLIKTVCGGNVEFEALATYYEDGQLKSYGKLFIPYFEKD